MNCQSLEQLQSCRRSHYRALRSAKECRKFISRLNCFNESRYCTSKKDKEKKLILDCVYITPQKLVYIADQKNEAEDIDNLTFSTK